MVYIYWKTQWPNGWFGGKPTIVGNILIGFPCKGDPIWLPPIFSNGLVQPPPFHDMYIIFPNHSRQMHIYVVFSFYKDTKRPLIHRKHIYKHIYGKHGKLGKPSRVSIEVSNDRYSVGLFHLLYGMYPTYRDRGERLHLLSTSRTSQ